MATRSIIFRGAGELTLPVTPERFAVETGVNVEVVNIHQLGDVLLLGYGTLGTIKISCLLPANPYPFSASSSPMSYINTFEGWIEDKAKLRFVVSGAGVNLPVVIEHITWGERDGTNDVYADITIREYRAPGVMQMSLGASESKTRSDSPALQSSLYVIKAGDTLSAICRKYYGDSSAATYNKLAAANGIANPHLIYTGNTLTIPQPLR